MKAYIAILIDSFWEAVGNKVLWALLLGWTVILAGLFPFGYVSESSFRLSSFDIQNKSRLVEKLARGAKDQGPADIRAVANRLDADFLTRLKEIDDKKAGQQLSERELAQALNAVVKSESFYDEELFPTAQRRQRLEALVENYPSGLSPSELEQLNRELLQLVFPLELSQPRGEQLWIGYAGFKFGEPLAVSRRQINQFFEPLLLTLIIKLGLGVVAIFVALVVTSSIIPDTFRSSSLHLLLSKPISRVWLFLWKFFGASIFVFFNITFVLVGLYFIAGLRFDIWNNGLLGCIPLLMFVFIIFYSVSALAGLLWGNAIVCVISCMVFWLFCFGLGVVREVIMRNPIELNQQITRLRPLEDQLLSVTVEGDLNVWNKKFSVWQPALDSEAQGLAKTFGPLHDSERNVVAVKSFTRIFGNLQARSRKLSLIRLQDSKPGIVSGAKPLASTAAESTAAREEGEPASDSRNGVLPTAAEPSSADAAVAPESALPNPFDEAHSDRQSDTGEQPVAFSHAEMQSLPTEQRFVAAPQVDEELADEELSAEELAPREIVGRVANGDERPGEPVSISAARREPRWIPEQGPELPQQMFDLLEVSDGMIAISRNGLYRLSFERLEQLSSMQGQVFGFKIPWLNGSDFEDVTPAGYFTSDNTSASVLADKSGIVVFSSGTLNVLKMQAGKFNLEKSVDLAQIELEGDGTEATLVQMNANYCVVARDKLPIALLTSNLEKKAVIELPGDANSRQLAWIPGTDLLSIVTHTGELFQLDCESGKLSLLPVPFNRNSTCVSWQDSDRVWIGVQPNRAHLVNRTDGSIEQSCIPTKTNFELVYYWVVNPLYLVNPKPAALDNAMNYFLTGDQSATTQLITNDLAAAQVELQVWQPIFSNLAFVAVILGISCVYVARREF